MEEAAPFTESKWDCAAHCRVGSLAYAGAVGALGATLDRQTLEGVESTIEAYGTCPDRGRDFDEMSRGNSLCIVAKALIEPDEVWV